MTRQAQYTCTVSESLGQVPELIMRRSLPYHLPHVSFQQYALNCTAVILNVDPVPDLVSVPVKWNLLVSGREHYGLGYQLLNMLVWAEIIAAVCLPWYIHFLETHHLTEVIYLYILS